jgi:DHA3 family macrolide efflux protein-like MFS transporter
MVIASLTLLIPSLLTFLIGGVVADKFDRKKVLLLVDSIQALSIFIMWVLFSLNLMEFWMLYFFLAIQSVWQSFHIPTEFAIIPTMVPKKHLSRINGINYGVIAFIQIIAPIVASRLYSVHSIKPILWVSIITFLFSIVPLILVKIPSVRKEEYNEQHSFGKQFISGFIALITIPGLFFLIVQILLFDFLNQPFNIFLSIYIRDIHMGSSLDFQLIEFSLIIGTIIGVIITAIKGTWRNKTSIISLMILIHGITFALFAFAPTGNFVLLIMYSAIMGLTLPIISAILLTILQTSVPLEKVGKISSIYNLFSSGLIYAAGTISGIFASFIGLSLFFFILATLYIISTIMIFFFTNLRNIDYIKEVSES